MKNLKLLSVIIFFFLVIILFQTEVMAIGVQPMTFDFRLNPGATRDFTLILSSSSKKEKVNISIYEAFQKCTGSLSYQKAIPETFPEMNWINLDKDTVVVPKDGNIKVNGRIKVPFGTKGSHVIILMIEPEAGAADKGVSLRVRYAVRIIIKVNGPALRKKGKVNYLRLQKGEAEKQMIVTEVENNSQIDYEGKVELTIRDKKRRLIERMTLRTISGHRNQRNSCKIYPGSKILFVGWPEYYLEPGTYQMRAFFKYGDRGQKILSKTVTVSPGQFPAPASGINRYFEVNPEKMSSKLEAKKRESGVVEIKNLTAGNLYCKSEIINVDKDYNRSLINWLKLYNHKKKFQLPPRGVERFVRIVQVPAEVENGGYYGLLKISAYRDKVMTDLLDEKVKVISCLIGGDNDIKLAADNFESFQYQKGYKFKLDILNESKIHFKPRAELVLKNNNDKIIKKIDMRANNNLPYLLPDKSWSLDAFLEEPLGVGNYRVEIELFNEDTSLQKLCYPLEIADE